MIVKKSFVHILATLIAFMLCMPELRAGTSQRMERMERYSATEGLSSNMTHGMTEDSLGHIWVCTDYGLSRFDGSRFKRFEKAEYPSLLRNDFFCASTQKDGSVLIGSHLGVALKYDACEDTFLFVAPKEFEKTYYKQISGFCSNVKGETYMWTSGGIYLYNKETGIFTSETPIYEMTKDTFICSMYVDPNNRIWICTYNSLKIIQPDGKLIRKDNLDLGEMYASKIISLDKNHLLITCFSNNLIEYTLADDGQIIGSERIRLPFSNTTSVLRDRSGRIWFTTDGNGLWYTDEELSENTDFVNIKPAGYPSDVISKLYCILESKDGDLWIGTQNTGIWRYKKNKSNLIMSSQDIPFPEKMCSDFIETEEGGIYAVSDGGGLSWISNDLKTFEQIPGKAGENNQNALSIAQEDNGKIWIATWGGGVQIYDPASKTFKQERFEELKSILSCFFSVNIMKNNEIWICTGGDGLYVRRTDGHWEKFMLPFGGNEYDMWTYGVTEGTNGTRWIITTRSIWRVNGTNRKPLIADISKQKTHDPICINDAACDKAGNLYVGCDQIILKFSENGEHCDTLDFIPKDNYFSLELLTNGEIIARGNKGIYRIDLKGKQYAIYPYEFHASGTGRFRIHGSIVLKDGRILFGTKEGFIVVNLNQKGEGAKTHHFGVTCETVNSIPYRETDIKQETDEDGSIKEMTVKYGQTDLTFRVDLVNYFPKEIICEYMLEGLSDKWTEVNTDRGINFSFIPSGSYILHVRNYLSGEEESAEVRDVQITVLPPWWQTIWFKIGTSLLLALLLGAILNLRIRRLKKEQIELQEKVKERTHELDEKNAELRLVLQDKDRLISVIAHDLKNPMFAIVGTLEQLNNKEIEADNEYKKTLRDVHQSAETLQNEMVRLLEWAKAKKEEIECKHEDVNVGNTLQNLGLLLGGLIRSKEQTLDVTSQTENCAYVDSRMFSTIIRNLITNAVKFTPKGGRIALTAWQSAGKIYVSVEDNGVGMSQETLEQIRNNGHVQSTLGTQEEKGSGLGLGLCKDYLNRINGEMEITSELGQGTKITISVPASERKAEEAILHKEEGGDEHLIDKDLLGGNTVLIVEDDPLIRKNIQHTLERHMTVLSASNGAEALSIAKENELDIILSDVEMPEMNGIEMSREMAKMDNLYGVPLLFLSAKTDESDRLMGLLTGAVDYIPKPFSSNELLIKINNILSNRRKQQIRILQQNIGTLSSESEKEEGARKEGEEEKEEKMNPFLQRMVDEIAKNYKESDFSIETLAETLNVSQSTLARKIKSITGKTPIEILVEYRLNAALALLKENKDGLQINEIAYECGFTDPAYFTRKFKEFFGYTPRTVK